MIPSGVLRWTIVAAVLLSWEVLPRAGLVPALFLPPLTATLHVAVADWREYAANLGVTLWEVAASMLLACGGGLAAGAVVGSVAGLRVTLLPVLSSLYAVPLVIVYPVLTVWFGIGPASKIAFAGLYGFFPTTLATAAGIRTIDPSLLLAARSMGASPLQRIALVVLPASIPTVLAGLRLGGALVIVGVVVAEMLVATEGIGYLVSRYRTILDSPHVFAAVLLVLVVALAFDLMMRMLERRTRLFQVAGRQQAG
jgi:NitT/TauT family transport system permease protein/taurine transport system permease protein